MTTRPEVLEPSLHHGDVAASTRLGRLVRAELLKARSTRSMWVLGAAGVAFTIGFAALSVFVFMPLSAAPIETQLNDAYSMTGQAYLMAIILGVVVMAGEYRHKTITWAFLVTPRRSEVVLAKMAACGTMGVALGLACAAVTGTFAAVSLAATGQQVWTPGVAGVLIAAVLSTGMWAVFGAALGALARNQVAGVVVAFVWFFYVEWFLVQLLPEVGRWVPTGAARAAVGWSREGMVGFDGTPIPGELLPVWAGALLFVGYVAVAAVAAQVLTVRRDVT